MNVVTQKEVASLRKIAQTSVSYIWRKYLKTKSIWDKELSGRFLKTTITDRRMLIITSKKNSFFTARQINDKVHVKKSISLFKVWRILRESHLYEKVAIRKPILNKTHIRKRLLWFKSYVGMLQSQWENFLEKISVFSDWPPLSPDFNIIENLWSILKDRVCQRHNKTTSNLWSIIMEKWNAIPYDTINNLYRSIT